MSHSKGIVMLTLEQVAEFRCCITCVYRRFYPPSLREGEPIFFRFHCERAADSGKPIVRPEDACDFWRGATLGLDG